MKYKNLEKNASPSLAFRSFRFTRHTRRSRPFILQIALKRFRIVPIITSRLFSDALKISCITAALRDSVDCD